MANKSIKYIIGFFVLVILSVGLYIILPGQVRLDISPTNTKFSVFENNTFKLAATEYVYLYDGSTKMLASTREIAYSNNSGIIKITRKANYKNNISTFETYAFDSTKPEIELIPIAHETDCINCAGKILQFQYNGILYDGVTKDITSPFFFGHNMKVAWQDGAYYAKVFQQSSDKIVIKYKVTKNYEVFNVRLFDPVFFNKELVKNVCIPIFANRIETVFIYKNCTTECAPENLSCVPYEYRCYDHSEAIEHINEPAGCVGTGQVNVSGSIISYPDYWCELVENDIACISYKEGGQWNTCKSDGSVTCFKIDLNTGKEAYYSSPGINIGKVINFVST